MYVGETQGVITRVFSECVSVEGEVLTDAGYTNVDVCVGDIPVYDLLTGLRVPYTKARKGMSARVAYEMDDDPPPYPGVVLWLNANHSKAAVFTAVVSGNIRYEAEGCVFLTADGKYRIVLSDETVIHDPEYGDMTHDDVIPGQKFFIWVDSITASCPAWVYPDKAVLVR
jgi:hypothetical protein